MNKDLAIEEEIKDVSNQLTRLDSMINSLKKKSKKVTIVNS